MAPSPIPKWDIPNLDNSRALHLFGAGREKRLYAVPPYCRVEPLEFEDVLFDIEQFSGKACYRTGYGKAFLDELYFDDYSRHFVINDSNFMDKISHDAPIKQHSNKYLNALKS
jgi:alpha-D-ribose 1-methylphosphonate 5-phosphate C-P lyase